MAGIKTDRKTLRILPQMIAVPDRK